MGAVVETAVRQDERVDWRDDNRERLEVALTESDVVGVRLPAIEGGAVDVLLHVLALPESGPVANDPRRMLRFCGVDDVRVLLRRVTRDGDGPPIELADLDAVEGFFESLVTGESLYGWRYFDEPSLTEDWPEQPSLRLTFDASPAPHQFYWFNECGRHEQGELRSYCIEGTIGFRDLEVLDAAGRRQNLDEFIADGARWWRGLQDSDPRVSVDAQSDARERQVFWRHWSNQPWSARPSDSP